MKTKINSIIIVEGKTDIAFLSSFIDANFYQVNGTAISDADIEYLTKAKEHNNLIILTDPDFPGNQIRKKINDNIEGCYNAYITKENAIKNNKVGVAESTKEEILLALSKLKIYEHKKIDNSLTIRDLYDLNLNGKEDSKLLREKLCDYLRIGYSNNKKLLNKLNLLGIDRKQLEEAVKNVNNK